MQALLTGAPLEGGKRKKTKAEERRLRGTNYTGDADSVVLEEKQKIVHLRPYEKDLRAQRFAEALDKVLVGVCGLLHIVYISSVVQIVMLIWSQ